MSATTPDLIDHTLARMAAAWNAGGAAVYAALFTADATYVAFNGQMMRGRAAIEDGHRWLFEGPLHSSRMIHSGGPVPRSAVFGSSGPTSRSSTPRAAASSSPEPPS